MPLDNRIRIVLVALNRQPREAQAHKIISPHDCDPHVTSSLLRNARAAGLADYIQAKNIKYWRITDAGRNAIAFD